MIPIRRLPLPDDINNRMVNLTEQITAATVGVRAKKAREIWRKTSTRVNIAEPLRSVLQRMAPGVERCMYCGDSFGTDIDHYEPIVHNPLRTFDWLNHLLACSNCNSHFKRELFPLSGDGAPLLINPTAEDPFEHLALALSVGEYAPLTEKGSRTIVVCGLNRFALSRARQQAYRVVLLCLREWRRVIDGEPSPATAEELMRTIREQPCADVCQAMLRQVEQPGASLVFAGATDVVELLRDSRVRDALLDA